MADFSIGRMEEVSLRSVWPHEERDFTPWLLDNFDLLGDALDLDLHSPSREVTLSGAGRADIVAQVRTDTGNEKVVIENQIEFGNDEHFIRLLGYAQAVDASVLVWVATDFARWHEDLVKWFNRRATEGIAMYLVRASAWRIGESAGLHLEVREGPPQPVTGRSGSRSGTISTGLGGFYRPLVARLRTEGVPTVGRRGYRGRWRSFPTGYPNVLYSMGVDGGRMWIFCEFREESRERYVDLMNRQGQVNAALAELDAGAELEWNATERWVAMRRDLFGDGNGDDQESRDWLFDKFLGFRRIMQRFLDELFAVRADDDAEPDKSGVERDPETPG